MTQKLGWDTDRGKRELKEGFGIDSTKELTSKQASKFIDILYGLQPVNSNANIGSNSNSAFTRPKDDDDGLLF